MQFFSFFITQNKFYIGINMGIIMTDFNKTVNKANSSLSIFDGYLRN